MWTKPSYDNDIQVPISRQVKQPPKTRPLRTLWTRCYRTVAAVFGVKIRNETKNKTAVKKKRRKKRRRQRRSCVQSVSFTGANSHGTKRKKKTKLCRVQFSNRTVPTGAWGGAVWVSSLCEGWSRTNVRDSVSLFGRACCLTVQFASIFGGSSFRFKVCFLFADVNHDNDDSLDTVRFNGSPRLPHGRLSCSVNDVPFFQALFFFHFPVSLYRHMVYSRTNGSYLFV